MLGKFAPLPMKMLHSCPIYFWSSHQRKAHSVYMQCSFCFPDLDESLFWFPTLVMPLIPVELFMIHIGLGASPLVRHLFIFHIQSLAGKKSFFQPLVFEDMSKSKQKNYFCFPF